MLGVPPCPQTHCSSSRRRLVLMGTAPPIGELRRKESQVHPTLLAPSRGSALLSLQRQPVPASPSQLTPKLPPSRETSINLPRKSHFMPKPCRLAHLMSSYKSSLEPTAKAPAPLGQAHPGPHTHLESRPRDVPEAARESCWARPGEPRFRGCCRIIGFRDPAGRGVGTGRQGRGQNKRGQPKGAWLWTRAQWRSYAQAQNATSRGRKAGGFGSEGWRRGSGVAGLQRAPLSVRYLRSGRLGFWGSGSHAAAAFEPDRLALLAWWGAPKRSRSHAHPDSRG